MMLSIEDFVQRIPSQLEKIITDSWGKETAFEPSASKRIRQMIDDRVYRSREARTQQQLDAVLEPGEKLALHSIFRFCGLKPFMQSSLEKEAQLNGIAGAELARGLAGLRRKGIVFGFARTWGEPVYAIPMESAAKWHQQLFAYNEQPDSLPNASSHSTSLLLLQDTVVSMSIQSRQDLLFEVLYTLRYIAANDIKLTRSGVIPKRHLTKWSQQLGLEAETIRPLSLEYLYCEIYPDHLALLLDMLLKLRLVCIQGDSLMVDAKRVQSWLSLSADEMRQVLYRVWKKVSFLNLPVWLHHFILWLESQPAGEPVLWTAGLRWLADHELLPDPAGIDQLQQVEKLLWEEASTLWLTPMQAFGWLEVHGEDANSITLRLVFSPAAPNNPPDRMKNRDLEASCFVQPDYEVIVPPNVSFSIHWQLDAMAERAVSDTVAIYRLSRKSVKQAVAEGYTAADCLAFLRTIAKTGVPEHVEQTISQWGDDPEWGSLRQEGKTGHTSADYSSLGIPEESVIEKAEDVIFSNETEARGIMLTDYYWSSWPVAGDIPDNDELYPGWRNIPAKWYKELLSYHSSTYKEMVRHALAWKSRLRLRSGDRELDLLPLSLQETGKAWLVTAMENGTEVVKDPTDWQAIQILLPGLS